MTPKKKPTKKRPYVWLREYKTVDGDWILDPDENLAGHDKKFAVREMANMAYRFPKDDFRITKYERVKP